MVNFDAKIMGPNGGLPIAYNGGTNTFTLMCHSIAHNADGSVTAAPVQLKESGGPMNVVAMRF